MRLGLSLTCILVLFSGCSSDPEATPTDPATSTLPAPDAGAAEEGPAEVAPVTVPTEAPTSTVGGVKGRVSFWGDKLPTGEVVFPTYAAHLLGQKTRQALADGKVIESTPHLVTVELENTTDKERTATLTFELSGFSNQGKKTFKLAPKQKLVDVADATLDFQKLGAASAAAQATYTYELEVDGELVKANGLGVQVQPKENAFMTRPAYLRVSTLQLLVGAMTTTNHPAIQQLLNIPGASFSGYQGQNTQADEVKVSQQVEKIYNAIKARGVNYVSTTESFYTGLQRVRWPSQSLDPKISSANCMDGSLLFAAAIEAINLDPFFVFVPGHVFIGYHLTKPEARAAGARVQYLETTAVGSSTFAQAVALGSNEVNVKYKGKIEATIHLADARKNGFKPGSY